MGAVYIRSISIININFSLEKANEPTWGVGTIQV